MNRGSRRGFALPTVLIASVVMLTILAASVSSVVAVRNAIKGQYYEQLAKAAGEAGVAYAKACLAKNGNVPLWSDAKPLTPATDCAGNSVLTNNLFRSLVVAGGGSGGGSTGGGGGAGGVVSTNDFPLANGTYSVVVGAGGAAAGNQLSGKNGGNSSFNGVTAIGGGGGGYSSSGGATGVAGGLTGGSGGGGQIYSGTYGPGAGTSGQGFAGGPIAGVGTGSTTGGGGAGGVGLTTASTNAGGNGGPGVMSTITGASVWYGGGGGSGGSVLMGLGGIGGGGDGNNIGTAGQSNTGGGGGGGWSYATGNSGAGGSGVVVISYPNNGTVATGGDETFVSGAYKVHIFRTVGTSSFIVSSITSASCPSDPRCSVMVGENMRSSFSVGLPSVDSEGKATAIPNNGYVELLRESNGAIWRTYKQPSVQAAVVPDLCSGSATSSLGWQNAVVTSVQDALPGASSAQAISLSDAAINPGEIYFRKDFSINTAGSYVVSAHTPTTSEYVNYYIDGIQRDGGSGASGDVSSSTPITLDAGCHTLTVKMVNSGVAPRTARFTLAIQLSTDSTPVVATDATWRVSTGEARHFSEPEYYASSGAWLPVYDLGLMSVWYDVAAQTGDWAARKIAPDNSRSGSGAAATFPTAQYSYLRDSKDVEVDQNTDVRLTAICDDNCVIYMDGQALVTQNVYSTLASVNVTLTPGKHRFAARLYNGSGPSGLMLSVVRISDGAVMTRTDRTWQGSDMWESTANSYYSYAKNFVPSPNEIPQQVVGDILVVGGGGGGANTGGGGGGGGLIFSDTYAFQVGSYDITIGNGGASNASAGQNGLVGSNTVFGSLTARGGGYGASHGSNPGGPGGSGGGAGISTGVLNAGGVAYASGSQGRDGGAGFIDASWVGNSGGGGGAGGVGVAGGNTAYTGHGGPGFVSTITGMPIVYAAGGGAGEVSGSYVGKGDTTAGSGTLNAAGTAATANTGSGGGGGSYTGSYFIGGAGGSGVVVVRYKTGTVTATGGTVTSWNGYTIHRFTSSGTFEVTAVNS